MGNKYIDMKENKLIAEFMGLELEETLEGLFVYAKKEQSRIKLNDIKTEFYEIHELLYQTSWDWLMPVVDKIEEMGFKTAIKTSYVRINPRENAGYEHYISYITFNEDGWSSRKPYASYDDDYLDYIDMGNISYTPKEIIDKRRAIFEAVIAFINWYNKNK